jgi:superfamily I DNA and/or RNA helicase
METCKAKEEELERRISAIDEDAIFKSIKEEFQYIESVELGKRLLKQLILKSLSQNDAIAKISSYMQSMPLNGQLASSFLDVFNLNCVTNLSIKSAFPLERDLIDLLIIDEASQCDISSALPMIQRSKQIVVIGDPMQLKHITNVTSYEEGEIKAALNLTENNRASYRDVSLWDYCNTLLNSTGATSVVLDNHFRCNYGIIGYSKEFFYRRRLGINLNIKTTPGNVNIDQEGIIWEDVIGSQKNEMQNINEEEAKRCIEIAEKLAKKYPNISIGIISPFKHQAQEISSMIHKDLSGQIVSDTVHKFQGDEKDVIIYSLVVTDDSSEGKIRWIDYSVPNLVNVAVTRARKALYVVGNLHYIQTHSSIDLPLGYLAWYAENKQKINLDSSNQTFVIDTNVFIEDSDILERINPRDLIVLPAKVLDELDKLKTSKDSELKGKAELALRKIKNAGKNRKIRYEIGAVELLPVDFNAKNADNIILSLAIKYRNQNAVLLTSDNGLISKAKAVRVNVKSLKELQ